MPPPTYRFVPEEHYSKLSKRFQKWLSKRKRTSQPPKTREKLINTIKPFCCIRFPVLSAEYVYARLYEQNFIDIDDEGDLILVNRKFDGFPSLYREPNHWTKELNEVQLIAVSKCFNWVTTLESAPGSFWALRHCIDQLCLGKGEIDPVIFVDYLCTRKIIRIDDNNNVTYNKKN